MNPEDILPPVSETPAETAPEPTPDPAPSPKDRVSNILPVTQLGERTIQVIKRHPIGIYGVYATCGLVMLITAVLAFMVMPGVASDKSSNVMLVGVLVFLLISAVCVGFALIAAKIYWGNSWTLTTDSITQVNQSGLFSRQSSQLSLADLEDVTSEQNGAVAELFNYGVLRVETAGDKSKFMFPYCPNPNYYAQQILTAREAFEQNRRLEEGSHQEAPQTPQPSQATAVTGSVSPNRPPVAIGLAETALSEDEAVSQAFHLSPTPAKTESVAPPFQPPTEATPTPPQPEPFAEPFTPTARIAQTPQVPQAAPAQQPAATIPQPVPAQTYTADDDTAATVGI